jgi:hypothetical protein
MDKSSNSRDFVIDHFGAYEQSDGSYLDDDGAITWYNEEGQYHREDGPALIYACNGVMYWFINGANYTFADWLIELNITDEAKMLLRLQYG